MLKVQSLTLNVLGQVTYVYIFTLSMQLDPESRRACISMVSFAELEGIVGVAISELDP